MTAPIPHPKTKQPLHRKLLCIALTLAANALFGPTGVPGVLAASYHCASLLAAVRASAIPALGAGAAASTFGATSTNGRVPHAA